MLVWFLALDVVRIPVSSRQIMQPTLDKFSFIDPALYSGFRRFARFAKPDLKYMALVFILILSIAVLNTALIWLIGTPFSQLQSGNIEIIYQSITWCVLLIFLNIVLNFIVTVSANWLSLRFISRLRRTILSSIFNLSFPLLGKFKKGDLLARLSNDVDRVLNLVIEIPFALASHVFGLIFYMSMLLWIDWKITAGALLFLPLLYFQQRYFSARKHYASRKFLEKNGQLLSFEEQSIGNLRSISSFNIEPVMSGLHHKEFEASKKWLLKSRLIDASFTSTLSIIIYSCALSIIFYGLLKIQSGEMLIGEMVSFLLYMAYLSAPVRGIAQIQLQCQADLAATSRIEDIIDAENEVKEKCNAIQLNVSNGGIAFKNLSFSYPDQKPLYKNLNFSIPGGETVALVGPSGSGKSTFIKLLLRFFNLNQGSILIDGKDINEVSLKSLRSNIAVVWQDHFLLDDTIRNNLLLAKPNANEEEVVRACKSSYCLDFINHLENGLDTKIGAKGISLSAGQSQRLAIAQAFLKDAPILILDEASSAIDSMAEKEIAAALRSLRQGRTTLIIAHRYTAIQSASSVIYFNGDGSVTIGNHEKLMKGHAGYQQAVKWQTGNPGLSSSRKINS